MRKRMSRRKVLTHMDGTPWQVVLLPHTPPLDSHGWRTTDCGLHWLCTPHGVLSNAILLQAVMCDRIHHQLALDPLRP